MDAKLDHQWYHHFIVVFWHILFVITALNEYFGQLAFPLINVVHFGSNLNINLSLDLQIFIEDNILAYWACPDFLIHLLVDGDTFGDEVIVAKVKNNLNELADKSFATGDELSVRGVLSSFFFEHPDFIQLLLFNTRQILFEMQDVFLGVGQNLQQYGYEFLLFFHCPVPDNQRTFQQH